MTSPICWQVIGFVGQGVFTARFLVQWIASEKKRDSVVPVAFWWLSLVGGFSLLVYAIHRRDPVFIVGQGMGTGRLRAQPDARRPEEAGGSGRRSPARLGRSGR